mgnify:CR=1 FL=1
MTQEYLSFTEEQAGAFFHHPSPDDDKYRRGVVGLVVGSETYPGAGLLASFAAAHSGIGMVRLNAPRRVEDLVLSQVPGVVTLGGRIQAGLVGPGCDSERSDDCAELARFCVDSQLPLVIDAGALDQVVGLVDYAKRQGRSLTRTILTPHHGEAARLLSQLGAQTSRAKVDDDPHAAAASLVELTGAVVVLKSSRTLCVYAEYTEGHRNLKGIEIPQEMGRSSRKRRCPCWHHRRCPRDAPGASRKTRKREHDRRGRLRALCMRRSLASFPSGTSGQQR